MEKQLQSLLAEAESGAARAAARAELDALKARYLGGKGAFTALMKKLGRLPKEERPAAGRMINEAKRKLETLFERARRRVEEEERKKHLGPPPDPALPSPGSAAGSFHLLTLVREEICSVLRKVGFTVAEGSEVETEFFCFDALNTPPDHPARDLQDTYYLPGHVRFGNVPKRGNERYLLRTHTSTVQIRAMLRQPPPFRFISPGRCFRRDTADATHSANFHQIEGLCVEKNVTVKDLKAVLDYLFRSLLGPDARTRFRPHFFPYTEPSFEVDFHSSHLSKLGREWVEIMGCGMVDPNVFAAVGCDPGQWTGYAFGLGIERIAMILYGIDDIRVLYQNDLRFLRQFA